MTTPEKITHLGPGQIFVFGSNLAGRHGAGAAKQAVKFGAEYGVGEGPSGWTYAIPTKDEEMRVLPLPFIENCVKAFIGYARTASEQTFLVTPIGCGLAGYRPEQIAPFFEGAPNNVVLPKSFSEVLGR